MPDVRNTAAAPAQEPPPAPGRTLRWFEQRIEGLPAQAYQQLREYRESDHARESPEKRKWARYAEQFHNMRFAVPAYFRREVDPGRLCRYLMRFCRQHDLPEPLALQLTPMLVNYISTGRMRPVILVGEPGCGKTTAARMLLKEALGIPIEVVKAPAVAGARGLTGSCATFHAADVGPLARAQLRHNTLVVGYIVDEIDKVTETMHRAPIDEELLSITDESVFDIEDNFLEFQLVSLPHCPFIFTGNDLEKINPILADRCTVIHFPTPTEQRICSITLKYAADLLKQPAYRMVQIDAEELLASIRRLISQRITSLRKYQELVEKVVSRAFVECATNAQSAPQPVTQDMYLQAEAEITGSQCRKVGFMVR